MTNSLTFVIVVTFILFYIKVKKGTVKFFNESKRFGFVREGEAVEFDLIKVEKV